MRLSRVLLRVVLSAGVLSISACGDDDDGGGAADAAAATADAAPSDANPFIEGFNPPAPGPGQIQVIAPPVLGIEPGADVTMCAYIDYRTPEELDIVDYQGFQSTTGAHHVILYAVNNSQPANVHECNEDDMVNARYLAGGGADSPPADLPENVVFRMPANKQLLIQTHWINGTEAPIDGQGAFNLSVAAPTPEHKPAQLVTIVNASFALPIGPSSVVSDCVVQSPTPLNVFMLGGHMHEWGTHAKITYTPVGGAPEVIYETDWNAEYQFNPPRNHYTTEAPFVLSQGDRLHLDCDYVNDTSAVIPFPSEMCVLFSYAYPLSEQIDCVNGAWPN